MSIRTNNSNVPRYWSRSQAAHSNNKQYSTDGGNLYSYRKLIGITLDNGDKVLLEYTSPAGFGISVTTSCHVSKARLHADVVMNPDAALTAGLIRRV
jgi:hypothetical protein